MPHVLFLYPASKVKGGNYSTISRISSHLEHNGHTCTLWDVSQLEQAGDVDEVLQEHLVDIIIGIHAFRAGRIMKDCKVPYVLILGGTDVNEFWKDKERMAVMTEAVSRARCVVAFSESLQKSALSLWPDLPQKQTAVITQAVITNPQQFSLHSYLQEHHGIESSEDAHIFLLVAAIRSVKNPIYLMDTFSEWHKENEKILYVIMGPVADEDYYQKQFKPALQRCKGIAYIPGVSLEETHAIMQQCTALVNSSESEGMSLAILEAMQLNVPILAVDIAGNKAIIEDGHTGLLFSTPQEFREKATRLISDAAFRKKLVKNASEYTALHHNAKQEEMAYLKIIQRCLPEHVDRKELSDG